MEQIIDNYTITTDKGKINVPYTHAFLSQASYWAENIPLAVVQRSIEGSLCFVVLHHDEQVGFARVITDGATFAYLADVFIDPAHRGRGLSKRLMEAILAHPSLQGLRRFMLATRDAHGLYRQYGFTPLTAPDRWMQVHQPEVYKEQAASG
ncbi:MAG TPA: GNAT family N-acetyltransferase [Chitinophagaceae bacterium]